MCESHDYGSTLPRTAVDGCLMNAHLFSIYIYAYTKLGKVKRNEELLLLLLRSYILQTHPDVPAREANMERKTL